MSNTYIWVDEEEKYMNLEMLHEKVTQLERSIPSLRRIIHYMYVCNICNFDSRWNNLQLPQLRWHSPCHGWGPKMPCVEVSEKNPDYLRERAERELELNNMKRDILFFWKARKDMIEYLENHPRQSSLLSTVALLSQPMPVKQT